MPGLIPQSFIDNLLDRVDIVEVIDRRVKLKKTGKNFSARCPFHDEKTPSFSVNPEKQFYYCFGCGAGGNALGFVMDYENLEFPGAVESLANSAGLQVPREQNESGRTSGHRELYELLEEAARYYQEQLRKHPQRETATDYLKGRGLTGLIAQQYGLGYAPPGWDNLLKKLGNTAESISKLERGGLIIPRETHSQIAARPDAGYYDRFRERVVFPIRDQRGRVIGFGGRVLGDDKPKYLNSPETEVFQKGRELYGLYEATRANRKLERIVIVEGYMDVIALAQHGITWATATLGTATSEAHLQQVYRRCSEVIFCFDGDDAGRKAAQRALQAALPCMEDGRQARFLFLPEGEDPDTLVRARGAAYFLQMAREAAPLEDFLFDHLSQGLELSSMDGRARLSKLAAPLLNSLPAGVYRQLMFRSLADRTGLEVTELTALVEQQSGPPERAATEPRSDDQPQTGPPPVRPIQRQPLASDLSHQKTGFRNLTQSALALLLHHPRVAQEVPGSSELDRLEGEEEELLRKLLALLQREPHLSIYGILGRWYGTPEGDLLNSLASQERLIPTEGVEKQFIDTINVLSDQLRRQNISHRFDKLRDRDYADISDVEKLEVARDLQEKHRLDSKKDH